MARRVVRHLFPSGAEDSLDMETFVVTLPLPLPTIFYYKK